MHEVEIAGSPRSGRVRIVRVIARLNVGGPPIQAINLTKRLAPLGYVTTLVRGQAGEHEGSMEYLAQELGVSSLFVPTLRRDPGWRDLRALVTLVAIMRRERPQVVHTHAAKAGTLGRLAALIAAAFQRPQPVLVHTFHGHSLTGNFSTRRSAVYLQIERFLARHTTMLVAVSEEVRDELVALGVAPEERFEVVPLGFDLSPFTASPEVRSSARDAIRTEFGIPPDTVLVTMNARVVQVKRIDRFLRAAARLRDREHVRYLIVGDGDLRDALENSDAARELGDRLTWAGFRTDIPQLCFASDMLVLSSDMEGTPVCLIEAAAAGLPTICTRVGGAATVIVDGKTGLLVDRDDVDGLAAAMRQLADNRAIRVTMGSAGRDHVLGRFSVERLISDLDRLYRRLLDAQARAL